MTGFWKELINTYTGLLSLHGHLLHDNAVAAEAANDPAPVGAAANGTDSVSKRTLGALETVLFLGGRPMHPDQPYDREEPFEQLVVPQDARDVQPQARCA